MEPAAAAHHDHQLPTEGAALTATAVSATLHCLTGCAIGEIAGLAIGTALGLSNLATVGLAVALAFLFGYGLTSLPLLRAGFALGAVIGPTFLRVKRSEMAAYDTEVHEWERRTYLEAT